MSFFIGPILNYVRQAFRPGALQNWEGCGREEDIYFHPLSISSSSSSSEICMEVTYNNILTHAKLE